MRAPLTRFDRRNIALLAIIASISMFGTGCSRFRHRRARAMQASNVTDAPIATPRRAVLDTYQGVTITDHYRWLEDPNNPEVQSWTELQNARTERILGAVPGREAVANQLTTILNAAFANYHDPQFRAGTVFALRVRPDSQQPYLVAFSAINDRNSERVVVDPNVIDPTGSTAIELYRPSYDGTKIAVALARNGSEEGTLHIFDAATGHELGDTIARITYPTGGGSIEWNADSTGLYYTRYPRTGERPTDDLNFYQQVYFHTVGRPESEDHHEVGHEFPRIAETVLESSPDHHWMLATVANGDGGEFAHYVLAPTGGWTQLTRFEDHIISAEFGPDDALYLLSRDGAPRGKILRLALTTPQLAAAVTVVEQSDAVIQQIVATDTRLYVVDLIGGPSQIRVFDHAGQSLGMLPLQPYSAVRGIIRTTGDEVIYRAETYLTPPAYFRTSPTLPQPVVTAMRDDSPVNYDDTEVVREYATSRDGTRVPVMIIRKRGTVLDGHNPTLLSGYGGYGISQIPAFSLTNRIWLDRGGVIANANLRGGGEFGEEWHRAGNLTHKQNVFDDFVAAAQHLIDAHYTTSEHLAIRGRSNGGLLMGAALTQHPELFRAVVSGVGIYDMLRVELDPNGAFNVTEFGTVRNPEQFQALLAYSPYHHVVDGTPYPAVFLTTGAHDGRVNPYNSRKMAARLQAATTSQNPILLRVSANAGHGMGSSRSEQIAEQTDVWCFLFDQLGLTATATTH